MTYAQARLLPVASRAYSTFAPARSLLPDRAQPLTRTRAEPAASEDRRAAADPGPTSTHPPTISVEAGDQPSEDTGLALGGEAGRGAVASAGLGGNATTMSTSDLSAATWSDYGQFKWWIKWVTDGTSGWIVQKIENTYSGSLADGTAITNASVGVEPTYYEAWEVAANGTITGSLGLTGNRDRWERIRMANGSHGSWGMTGTVYWTASDPAASGFTSGGVANAGSLLSSKTAPAGLSVALRVREAHGMWSSTGAQMVPGSWHKP